MEIILTAVEAREILLLATKEKYGIEGGIVCVNFVSVGGEVFGLTDDIKNENHIVIKIEQIPY